MISLKPEFELVDRGFNQALVLIPGWASDYRIFSRLNLDYNYILVKNLIPSEFHLCLRDYLSKEFKDKVSLLGCSLGGFLAAEFAHANPCFINELILVGIRQKYDLKTLENVRVQVIENKKAFLYKFYAQCFSPEEKSIFLYFKRRLFNLYAQNLKTEELLRGLDYLARAQIKAEYFSGIKKVKIIHGGQDLIAPLKEAEALSLRNNKAELIKLSLAGHIAVLNPGFKEAFYHEQNNH